MPEKDARSALSAICILLGAGLLLVPIIREGNRHATFQRQALARADAGLVGALADGREFFHPGIDPLNTAGVAGYNRLIQDMTAPLPDGQVPPLSADEARQLIQDNADRAPSDRLQLIAPPSARGGCVIAGPLLVQS